MLPSGTILSLHAMAGTSQRLHRDHTRLARLRREDALGRIALINRSIGAGALVVTAALGLYLSKALPGHQARTQSSSTSSSGSGPLAPPSSAPVQTQQPATIVSGAT
jgi:hypothetical protein